jgi:hypothetical protein
MLVAELYFNEFLITHKWNRIPLWFFQLFSYKRDNDRGGGTYLYNSENFGKFFRYYITISKQYSVSFYGAGMPQLGIHKC